MTYWKDADVQREYYAELVRRAERKRMVRTARDARTRTSTRQERFYHGVFVRLGEWLVAVGCRLQARYGTMTANRFDDGMMSVSRRTISEC